MSPILAFDIGIKNLAWCCLEKKEDKYYIIGWDNYNLLSESSNIIPGKQKITCSKCSLKGLYSSNEVFYCSRHCPISHPPIRDPSGNLLKKLPTLTVCRSILNTITLPHKTPAKKEDVHNELAKFFSLPIPVLKVSKAPDAGLTDIHTSIQKLVKQHSDLWSKCSVILLENQPAFKNPTMKSVQILLFATLRDMLHTPTPPLKLVHAGKKVQGAVKGDAGYKDRKLGSEDRVVTFLKDPHLMKDSYDWQTTWSSASKKSDLADALCMCIDAHVSSSSSA